MTHAQRTLWVLAYIAVATALIWYFGPENGRPLVAMYLLITVMAGYRLGREHMIFTTILSVIAMFVLTIYGSIQIEVFLEWLPAMVTIPFYMSLTFLRRTRS